MGKIVLLMLGLGALVLGTAAVALARGGKDIAHAPVLRANTTVTGGGAIVGSQRAGSCSGYGEFWRLSLARGDHLDLAYASRNRLDVKIVLLDPSVSDANFNQKGPVGYGETFGRDHFKYVAQTKGRYTVVLYTGYPCQPTLAYSLIAHVRHA